MWPAPWISAIVACVDGGMQAAPHADGVGGFAWLKSVPLTSVSVPVLLRVTEAALVAAGRRGTALEVVGRAVADEVDHAGGGVAVSARRSGRSAS